MRAILFTIRDKVARTGALRNKSIGYYGRSIILLTAYVASHV
jgi:hypothetical protein